MSPSTDANPVTTVDVTSVYPPSVMSYTSTATLLGDGPQGVVLIVYTISSSFPCTTGLSNVCLIIDIFYLPILTSGLRVRFEPARVHQPRVHLHPKPAPIHRRPGQHVQPVRGILYHDQISRSRRPAKFRVKHAAYLYPRQRQ
ncbi:MAG: hypothetical protein ACNA8H_07380 [Anaerolineales bacterium]